MIYNPIIIKTSDNINRIVDSGRNENTIDNIIQSNTNVGIPLVYGTQMYAPTLIYQATDVSLIGAYKTAQANGSVLLRDSIVDTMAWIGVYAVTLNQNLRTDNYAVQQIFINGETWTNYDNFAPFQSYYSLPGFNANAKLTTGKPGNIFGEKNIFVEYVRPGSSRDEARLNFLPEIGGNIVNHQNMLCNMYNIANNFALNTNVALLVIAIHNLDTEKLQNRPPRINIVTTRYPRIYDPADARDEREANFTGNAIYELMYNSEFGLGVDKDDINYFQFKDVGSRINTVLNVSNTRILDLINGMAIEDFGILSKVGGKWNYYDESSVSVAFTVDTASIIGNFEITYPDSNTAPTKIIADYVSYTSGTRQVSIGTDDSNVLKISIKHKNNITDVTNYLQYLFAKLNNTITYKFTMDKTATKFSLGDIIAVTSDTPDLNNVPMRIIGLVLNDDFTFDITAETVITASGTSVIFDSAKPVLRSGRPYKIDITEPTPPTPDEIVPDPIVPIGDPVPPPPGEIAPPAPTFITISGLNHPYNHVTSSDNLDWYLGATTDGTTADANYDANGIQTVAIEAGGTESFKRGLVYQNKPSLIYRRLDAEQPTHIQWCVDVATGLNEQNLGYVGTTIYGSNTIPVFLRYRYDGFFSNEIKPVYQFRPNGQGWTEHPLSWMSGNFITYHAYWPGGLHWLDESNGEFAYVYQPDDGARSNRNRLHTFDTTGARSPRAGDFTYATTTMRRSGVYRYHFSAVYGADVSGNNPTRVEYIGSTTFYGDGRGVLPQFLEASRSVYNNFSSSAWNYTYTAPPSRSIA